MPSASYSGAKAANAGTGTGTGTRYPHQDSSASQAYSAQLENQHPLPPTPPAPPPHDGPLSLTRLSSGTNILAEKNFHEHQHPLPPLPPPPPSKSLYNSSKLTPPAFIETFMARHPRVARHRRRFAALLFTLTTLLILLIVLLAVLLSRKNGSGDYEEGIGGGGGQTGSGGGSTSTDDDLKKHNQGIQRPPINRSNAGGWTKQGKGEGTYYDPSVRVGTDKFTMGACEFEYINSMQDMIAALNKPDFGSFPRSSNSPACGQCIRVTGPNGSVDVQIVDMCPGCKSGDIDLTPGAFSKVAHIDAGRVRITWERCP
ncbi:unnamed protein product [Mortierella alpina]